MRRISRLHRTAYLDFSALEQVRGLIEQAEQMMQDQQTGMNMPELNTVTQELDDALHKLNNIIYSL